MSNSPAVTPVTTTRLPLAHLPSAVLPGATVTLMLSTDALRLAITAATAANDSGIRGNGRLDWTLASKRQRIRA